MRPSHLRVKVLRWSGCAAALNGTAHTHAAFMYTVGRRHGVLLRKRVERRKAQEEEEAELRNKGCHGMSSLG